MPLHENVAQKETSSPIHTMISASGPEPGATNENTTNQDIATVDVVSIIPVQQIGPSEPGWTSQPAQHILHTENQTQNEVLRNVSLAASEQQTKCPISNRTSETMSVREPGQRETRSQDVAAVDCVLTSPEKPAHSPEPRRISQLELEQGSRPGADETGDTSQAHPTETGPSAVTSSELDLDSTPLANDAEAIIRQLEQLKAIVLARSTIRGGTTGQVAGDKRKASEPLSSLDGNPRLMTPKRAKGQVPPEENLA